MDRLDSPVLFLFSHSLLSVGFCFFFVFWFRVFVFGIGFDLFFWFVSVFVRSFVLVCSTFCGAVFRFQGVVFVLNRGQPMSIQF
jgi:hypothetical protein